ncbi:putative aminopeptidase [Naematelia encephala]|uniref:Peptide hydrolase n=1 Tax=Naematelia encephala TaxID=71784 RepID=A0A1Y2BHM6_9TREE|nr:putative aminopeptidase [Naematelia encephala]
MASLVPLLLLASLVTADIPSARWSGPSLIISNTRLNLPHECVDASYYGAYGGLSSLQDHVYLIQGDCAEQVPYNALLDGVSAHGAVVDLPPKWQEDGGRLVWIGRAGVQPSDDLDGTARWQEMFRDSVGMTDRIGQWGQVPLDDTAERFLAWPLHSTPDSFIFHVPSHLMSHLDTFLPSHLVPVALPISPLPANSWDPVPDKYAKHLANLTDHLKFDPVIDRIVSEGLKLDELRRNIRWLTGEAPSGIESRHSFTPGAIKAANFLKSKVEETGADCHLHEFLEGFAPNVICHYPTSTNSTDRVILSAHYDSRGSFGMTRAPGGDDDASGTGHLLAIASAIKSQGVKFDKSVFLAFFAGEEQGLLGSHAYAEWCHANNITVLLQVQADMLGYHDANEPMQLGLPESIHLPEATQLIANLSAIYSPELLVGPTAACCSDHQSFLSYGFPSTQVFERAGWIIDPMYHNSGDVSSRANYDFEQIIAIGKVTMAALLTVAGYSVHLPSA